MEFIIEEADDGIRLDRWFKRHHPGVTQGALQKYLRKGDVRLDQQKVDASVRLMAGQCLQVWDGVKLGGAPTPKPTKKPLSRVLIDETRAMVIHEDAHCLVLNKPAGLAVQGGSNIKDSVDDRLEALKSKGERPKLVHRLDKDTSGVLLLARTSKDARDYTQAFASKTVEKTYWALVVGVPEVREGTIDLPLAKEKIGGGAEKVVPKTDGSGKKAITNYRVLEALGRDLAWLELFPVTGRTHQLRAHMQAIGHPIVGDGKYGGRDAFVSGMRLPKKLHLHARRLVLDGEKVLDISAPLPDHMCESWKMLGLEVV